jgi:hypothetical protein
LQSPKEQRNQTDWKSLVALAARPCHASARCSRLGHGHQYACGPTSVPEARSCPPARWAATSDGTVGRTSKRDTEKGPRRRQAGMAPPLPNSAHGDQLISAKSRGTARFCATFICDALETDWLAGAAGFEPLHFGLQLAQDSQPGREDSNLCILESGSQLGARTRTCVSRITGAPAALSKNVAGVRPTTQPVEPR